MKSPIEYIITWFAAAIVIGMFAGYCVSLFAAPAAALKYRGTLTREAHFVHGLDAPIPMFAAQIEQESGWRPGVTSYDNGKGLAQFTGKSIDWIGELYPELGKSEPYNPTWAIRALVRYDAWLVARVKGIDECHRRAAALKGYNAGLGYVQRAQKASSQPEVWFGITEHVPTRQTPQNFEASRMYPRLILFKRQPGYREWGTYTCGSIA